MADKSDFRFSARRVVLALAIGLSMLPAVSMSEEEKCVEGQYVLEAGATQPVRNKAVEMFEMAARQDVQVTNSSHGTVLVDRNRNNRRGRPVQEMRIVSATEGNRKCNDLRRMRRDALRRGVAVEGGILMTRHVDCTCNYLLEPTLVPNDPMLSSLWGLYRTDGGVNINSAQAWEHTTGSKDTIVAVVDTGVDYNHPDLKDNIWTNPREIPGDGIDNDNNGFIDDVHGINASTQLGAPKGDPFDTAGHGTHVAGTIGAMGNNQVGVVGVNWKIQIMAVKFLEAGGGTIADAITAVNYVADMKRAGVNIVAANNSWGGGGYSVSLENAIKACRDAGVLFVAAAGNAAINIDQTNFYPASYKIENVIPVAAVANSGNLASFSCYGPDSVLIAAPGVDVWSTYPGNQYARMSGTSMATPHVTGALGLIASLSPNLGMAAYRSMLLDSARTLTTLDGKVQSSRFLDLSKLIDNGSDPGYRVPTPGPTSTPQSTPQSTPTPSPVPTSTATYTPTPQPTPQVGPYNFSMAVIGPLNKPLPGAVVRFEGGGVVKTTTTNSMGYAWFADVLSTPSTYTISVKANGVTFVSYSGYTYYKYLTIYFYGKADILDLSVRVITPDKVPLPGALISIDTLGQCVTDAQGICTFTALPFTPYSITATAEDYVIDTSRASGIMYGDTERLLVAVSE